MKKLNTITVVIALALIVASCSTRPPSPKKPDESRRVPINKTIPIELEGNLNDE